MSAASLPPWGPMEESIVQEMHDRPIPEAWRVTSDLSLVEDYTRWREELIEELAALLWPTYDFQAHGWSRPPSDALISADFQILQNVHHYLKVPVDGVADTPTLHEVFFEEEDDVSKLIGLQYERYDPALPEYLRASLKDVLINGFSRKIASLRFQLKERFQRPRAFQVALIQGRTPFHYRWAQTGGTPSFISGHCVEGSIAGASAYVLFGHNIDRVSVAVLQQFTVDIGDRRVFAGVHYPSDNLGSWYTALKLLPHVLEPSQVHATREFLWEAISKRSIVFREIVKDAEERESGSPYLPAIQALERIATGG
jgi:hypothetical protein